MERAQVRLMEAIIRIGQGSTASKIREELVNPPTIAVVWKTLEGMRDAGLLKEKIGKHVTYSPTAQGIKALAAAKTMTLGQ